MQKRQSPDVGLRTNSENKVQTTVCKYVKDLVKIKALVRDVVLCSIELHAVRIPAAIGA